MPYPRRDQQTIFHTNYCVSSTKRCARRRDENSMKNFTSSGNSRIALLRIFAPSRLRSLFLWAMLFSWYWSGQSYDAIQGVQILFSSPYHCTPRLNHVEKFPLNALIYSFFHMREFSVCGTVHCKVMWLLACQYT